MTDSKRFTYKQSGVDVAAGNEAVRLLKERLKSVRHPLVLEGIGGFGGVMRMPPLPDAVLVAGTDGVGTKVLLAKELQRFTTIGIDCVAMSANDVSSCGAVPLFFLDYLVVAKVRPEVVADIVAGVDEGCMQAQCVLLGGETGEHPGHFKTDDDFDLAGFCVGIASRDELWGPDRVEPGDALLGIAASGVHSNGFSLLRQLLAEHGIGLGDRFPGGGAAAGGSGAEGSSESADDQTVGDVLLTPTRIYSAVLHDLGHACPVHAAAHITGGGFPDNVGRILPPGTGAVIDLGAWRPAPVFSWVHDLGVEPGEMLDTFNCGLGMVLALPADHMPRALDVVQRDGMQGYAVGEVVAIEGGATVVRYAGELAL